MHRKYIENIYRKYKFIDARIINILKFSGSKTCY